MKLFRVIEKISISAVRQCTNRYDYNKDTKKLKINEKQDEIFQMYIEEKGILTIKRYLEDNVYLTSNGLKNWNISYITRVLQNSFCCGTVIYIKKFYSGLFRTKG